MGTLITDPNAPPDPTEVAPIPDHQMTEGWIGRAHNPVTPGAPPDEDNPTGVPPADPDPSAPPIDGGPPQPDIPDAPPGITAPPPIRPPRPPGIGVDDLPKPKKDEEKEDDHSAAKKAHKK